MKRSNFKKIGIAVLVLVALAGGSLAYLNASDDLGASRRSKFKKKDKVKAEQMMEEKKKEEEQRKEEKAEDERHEQGDSAEERGMGPAGGPALPPSNAYMTMYPSFFPTGLLTTFPTGAPALHVANTQYPMNVTLAPGQQDVMIGQFMLSAINDDITLTHMSPYVYKDIDGNGVFHETADGAANAEDLITSAYLTTAANPNNIISSVEPFDPHSADFFNLSYTIPEGQSRAIYVFGDISPLTPIIGPQNSFAVDLGSVEDGDSLSGIDSNGNEVILLGQDDVNGGANPMHSYTIESVPTVYISEANDAPMDQLAIAGTDDIVVGGYEVAVVGDDIELEEMVFELDSSLNPGAIDMVYLYQGSNLLGASALNNMEAYFGNIGLYVQDSIFASFPNAVELELRVDTTDLNMGAQSGDLIQFSLSNADFEATAQSSGNVITSFTPNQNIYGGEETQLFGSLPTFAKDTAASAPCPTSTLVPGAESEIYCFTVSADPAGPVGLSKVTMFSVPDHLDTNALSQLMTIKEYDASGVIQEIVLGTGQWNSITNLVSFDFPSEQVVNAGAMKRYVIQGNVQFTGNANDTSLLSSRLESESSSQHAVPTSSSSASGRQIWSDRSSVSHNLFTPDWVNGYRVMSLPTDYLQLTE